MRTPSGILHVVDFKTEQIVSIIQPKDYWEDKRHWEIKNNIDTLEFKTFDGTSDAATLIQQNVILKEVRDGRIIPYVINNEVERDSNDRSITAHASGAWVQIAKAGIIKPQRIESKTVNEFIDMALVGMKWKRGITEYTGFHTMTIDEFIDPLTFLKKIASLFDLEIQYRVEVVGSQVTGWYVDMIKKRGQETGKEVVLGKDLMGVRRIEHSRDICTALVGFVKGEGEKLITVESINNGLPYIVDNDAFQRWNEHGKHKFGFYTPETEEQNMTPQRLMTLMKTEFKKRVNTSVSYEVEAQSIGRVFGLAHELINEGDTIKIKDTGFTPKLYLEARVIAGDESFTDPTQDKYVFGDYREIVDPNKELRKIYNRILSSLGSKQEMLDQLDKLVKEANETASNAKKESGAAKTLAEKVQENLKNNTIEIIEAKNPPTSNLKDRKTLWLDSSNGKPGILKLWKDGAWDPVVPDVESVKIETLKKVNEDIEKTKKELTTKVETLKTETLKQVSVDIENTTKELTEKTGTIKTETETLVNVQIKETQNSLHEKVMAVKKDTETISGQIVNIKKDIEGKVDRNFVKEQIKDKADKSGVFTKDEINNGFVGKQMYETDKQGNVKKFQEISTSFEQTNEAIKSKAEKQSVTDLGNNVTQVSKTANEVKQTAEGNTRTITQVDSKVKQTVEDFSKKTTAIQETVNGVSTKITNIQTEQGKVSERVTKSEHTAEGFKQSIESLNKADGMISNKLNTVEQTVEGTKKTIADIQSEANTLKKTTNEIKETADGTKQTLIELKSKVNDMKGGGRNYVIKSGQPLTQSNLTNGKQHSNAYDLSPDFIPANLEGTTITISMDYQTKDLVYGNKTGGASPWIGYQLSCRDSTGKSFAWLDCAGNKALPTGTSKGFQGWSNTHKIPKGTVSVVLTRVYRDFSGTVTLKNVKLEVGNMATDYSVALEDQVSLVDFTKKTTDIEKSIDGVKTSVSTMENEQGKISKRMTTAEQTSEGLTTSVNKLNQTTTSQGKQIVDANTKIKQTSESLEQAIEKTNTSFSNLEKKTNEIKTTADSTKQTLTQLKSSVENQKIGGRNLLVKGNLEKTNSREFVRYADLAPIIDLYGLIEYTISFDIKVAVAGEVQVYMQNGSGAKYKFSKLVNATTQYERRFITVIPTLDNKTFTESWLSFFGTYDTGRLITVKNVKVEKGNVPTEYWPAPEEQTFSDEFTKKTVEIENTISGIKTSVSNVQNKQGKLTERVTKSEQKADGFKRSIESLTKKDSEISNKLNTIESNVEGTKKTISDVQSDTTKLKQTTTEMKEQAGKISEKLTSVEKKFNGMEFGGRNFLRNSNFASYNENHSLGWDKALNGSLSASHWSSGYNSGVAEPAKGYHAHINNKVFGYPVLAFVNKNSQVGQGKRWLGISTSTPTSFGREANPGQAVSISMDVWSDVEGFLITGGLHHFIEGSTSQSFHGGQYTIKTIGTKVWKRYSVTMKLHDKYDRKKAAAFYMYGNVGPEGTAYVKNVKFEMGNTSSAWTPAPEDQVSTDEFTKKTTEIVKSVDGVKTTVTKVQNNQNGFDKRIAHVETTASGLSSTVKQLNQTTADQGKKITEANTKLNQQAQAIQAKVEIKQVEDYIATFQIPELKNSVTQQKKDLLADIAKKVATQDYNKKTTELERLITANANGISLAAKRTEIYTRTEADGRYANKAYVEKQVARIDVTEKGIKHTVQKGNVISAINQTAEKIKISANLIDLVGKIQASWLVAGLLQGMTIKTSNTKEYIHMENQVLRFVNQGAAKIVVGFEDEKKSKTLNPYIILGEGDGKGRNFGSIYKDGNGVYYRYVDQNGVESNIRLTAQGNVGITAQNSMWLNSNGQIVLDGKNVVAINVSGRNVADFKQVNGVNFDFILGGNHMIRSSTAAGYDKLLQVKNVNGNEFRGLEVAEITAHGGIRTDTNLWAERNSYAMQHINRSTEKIKTGIHDLPFSPLEKVRGLKVKEYFLKRDMYELYQMRMNKPADRVEPYTTNDIETQYGLIAEETDDIFTTPEKDGIKLYTMVSILTSAVQELEIKHDAEIKAIEEKHNAEMDGMNRRIEALETLVQKLMTEKNENPTGQR